MTLTYYFLAAFLWLSTMPLAAQINPPDFQCTRNDTLLWVNVPNACGPYLSTHIMSAPDAAGPFTEIAVFTDPNQSSFHDPNPTGAIRFYYIFYRYDCPGQNIVNSDTLNNLIPTPPASTWVSEEEGVFVVYWTPSSSPETSGYRVYRQAPEGFIIVGNVNGANNTSFMDNTLNKYPPGTAYRVTAIDPCGNNSLFGPEVRTPDISVMGGFDCASSVSITPLGLDGASIPRPFTELALYASVDGGPYNLTGTFAPGTSSLSYTDGNNGERVCFYIEASIQGDPRPLRTPIGCTEINIIQPVRDVAIYGAGFTPNDDLILDFNWDDMAATQNLWLITRFFGGLTDSVLMPFEELSSPVARLLVPADELPEGPYTLSIRAEDICNNAAVSNMVAPIFLSGRLFGRGINQLTWTSLEASPSAVNIQYQLVREAIDGSRSTLYTGDDPSFVDRVGSSDPNLAFACYEVIALLSFEDGSQRRYSSNIFCLEQQTDIYFPNIFSFNASSILNREFCPGFSRTPTGQYQLDIFDRWGGHLFSSNSPNECWEGYARGQLVESGVYVYVLQLEMSGEMRTFTGDVTFLR